MFRRFLKSLWSPVLLSLLFVAQAQGRSINWGDGFLGTDLTSTLTPIDSSFAFELGTFGSFIPDAENVLNWRMNWKILDTADYNDSLKNFSSTLVLEYHAPSAGEPAYLTSTENPAVHFAEGEQVYIWIYNDLAQSTGTEWALFTNAPAWTLPSGPPSGQPDLPANWYVPDANTTPAGNHTPVAGIDSFQTSSFAAIPEPGCALLLVSAFGLTLQFRRRHRMSCPQQHHVI